ncbi:MAG: hypothetical protein IPM91_02240 [Bacteroidetes bacterium]|nr:hypothetical protein [Bacteroidota bacterium]
MNVSLYQVAGLMDLLKPLSNLNSLQIEKYMLPLDGDHMGVEMCWGHNASEYLVMSLQSELGKEK